MEMDLKQALKSEMMETQTMEMDVTMTVQAWSQAGCEKEDLLQQLMFDLSDLQGFIKMMKLILKCE